MKKTLIITTLVLLSTTMFAQGVSPYSVRNLRFGFEFTNDIWLNKPETLDLSWLNRGVNLSLLYHAQLGESNFGLASGLVLAFQNMYSKNSLLRIDEDGISYFDPMLESVSFRKYKLNQNYIELPIEFTYRTKSNMTFALGAKAGLLISDKTKYNGDNFLDDSTDDLKIKVFNHKNLEYYRLGAYAIVGYKWINVTTYYGFTSLFKKEAGPEMTPLTIGILIRPY